MANPSSSLKRQFGTCKRGDLQQMSLFDVDDVVAKGTHGNVLRKDQLVEPQDIQILMRNIHNFLATNASNMTRSEALAQQLITLLFCKLFDELNTEPGAPLVFQRYPNESPNALRVRLREYFDRQVREKHSEVFNSRHEIKLDSKSLVYIVESLQKYHVADADRDLIGDAFEAILGDTLKGSKGQFFTPRNAIRMILDIIDPQPGELILDPACGSGGFLVTALRHLQKKSVGSASDKPLCILVGIDKDEYLAKVANTYLQLLGAEDSYVFSENSLLHPSAWPIKVRQQVCFGSFDVVLTNPPFGEKLKIKDKGILSQFDLGHKWRFHPSKKKLIKTDELTPTPTQILFIERCLDFLRDGGRLGIVLPETLLGNPSYEYIMQYLQERVRFQAIISMPEELFQPFTHAKSCIIIARKESQVEDYTFFMGIADWCGHDSRGNPTIRKNIQTGQEELLDDIPEVARRHASLVYGEKNSSQTHLGFLTMHSNIVDNIFVPKYYDPEINRDLQELEKTHELIMIKSLVKDKILSIRTGIEVGRLAYGTGAIPFIRTSDIANWEVKIDPKHSISEDVYQRYQKQSEVRSGDILFVRDGTYLVGTSCILTEYDTKILFQSHIYRLRVLKPDKVDPFLLFAALNSSIVKRQVRAKQFTQHIIDTLGARIYELIVPLPRDLNERRKIAERTRSIVETRARLRQEARAVVAEVERGINSSVPNTNIV
jgi:type I restriction enzyme M protein